MFGVTEYVKWGGGKVDPSRLPKENEKRYCRHGFSNVPVLRGFSRSAKPDSEASRRRAGFTLVEVIVVIVIIAILAAIGVPALTGYIDKARWTDMELTGKTQMVAVQTMIIEQMTRDGGIVTGSFGDSDQTSYFKEVVNYASGNGYRFQFFTDYGKEEYIKLTGDTESIKTTTGGGNIQYAFVQAETDLNGAIVVYEYYDARYFPDWATSNDVLGILYFQNAESTDPVTTQVLSRAIYSAVGADKPTTGWNIGATRNNTTWEKLH